MIPASRIPAISLLAMHLELMENETLTASLGVYIFLPVLSWREVEGLHLTLGTDLIRAGSFLVC